MKALVRHRYGGPGVVRVEEVAQPALEDDRVLVRVRASSLNKADWHQLRGRPRVMRPMMGGILRPKNPFIGTDFAGIVTQFVFARFILFGSVCGSPVALLFFRHETSWRILDAEPKERIAA